MTDAIGRREGVVAYFGGQERALKRFGMRRELNASGTAEFELRLSHVPAVDFSAPVSVAWVRDHQGEAGPAAALSGHVMRASAKSGSFNVYMEDSRFLQEARLPVLESAGVSPIELMHLLVRKAGLAEEQVQIQDFPSFGEEVIAVSMPLAGVTVSSLARSGSVDIFSCESGGFVPSNPFMGLEGYLTARWRRPSAVVRTHVVSSRLIDGEEIGVERIYAAVDSLLAASLYSFARTPEGRDLDFDRQTARARPQVLPLVHCEGLYSGRRWLHSLGASDVDFCLDPRNVLAAWSGLMGSSPSAEVVRALRELRSAADEDRDVVDRSNSLSSVLEYYAASARPGRLVSKASLKSARRAISDLGLAKGEEARILGVLGTVNQPPLMARVKGQAAVDGVPVSAEEWSLLGRLRSARNAAVHGRSREAGEVGVDDMRWGVSVVSRLVTYRWAAESGMLAAPQGSRGGWRTVAWR